jgi:hypothetical protein
MRLYKNKAIVSLEQVWHAAVVVQVMASATHLAIASIPQTTFANGHAWKRNDFHGFWQMFSRANNWSQMRDKKLVAAASRDLVPSKSHNQFIFPIPHAPNFSPLLLPNYGSPLSTTTIPSKQSGNSSPKFTTPKNILPKPQHDNMEVKVGLHRGSIPLPDPRVLFTNLNRYQQHSAPQPSAKW